MRRFTVTSWLILAMGVLSASQSFAQNTLDILVKDAKSLQPLPGASAAVRGMSAGGTADENGLIQLVGIPNGNQRILLSFIGYESVSLTLIFPYMADQPIEVLLQPEEEQLEEIVISSTRGSRTFADIPTRIEFIAGEELEEKANMKPGDIRMLLSESTGIQTQQTSATSANASIRIQGLDGRYTQILKDGFPLYAGFSGGLGLLQTPPLDLKQVEVIKGSSSTLYGGGAIAGLVNLISRTPGDEPVLNFLLNGTSAGGLDLSGFYSEDYGKVGITVFGSRNSSEPYDPANIDLTAIPKFRRYTFNPRLFFDMGEHSMLNVGLNYTDENRIGGDIYVIEGHGDAVHRYYEKNISDRISTQLSFAHRLTETLSVNLRNSFNRFERHLQTPDYVFQGTQTSSFAELNFVRSGEGAEWVGGLNLWTDSFSEVPAAGQTVRDYRQETLGAFVQNNIAFMDRFHLETGIRADYVADYGFALLPRISLLYKAGVKFTSRIGGGFGYKVPTIFTEEIERMHFQNVLPVSPDKNKLERSYGANWDLNFRTEFGNVGFNINHLFFYTYLNDPLEFGPLTTNGYELVNLAGYTDTKGTETNIRLERGDFKLFVGYTFTDTRIHEAGMVVQKPLTAKHRLNNVLMYEVEEKWKVGLEAYHFSRQRLSDGAYGQPYWICGLMIEKLWERFSVFINFENFLDTRQTRFDAIYTGSISNPMFREIYAPVDGFVMNGGAKIKLRVTNDE